MKKPTFKNYEQLKRPNTNRIDPMNSSLQAKDGFRENYKLLEPIVSSDQSYMIARLGSTGTENARKRNNPRDHMYRTQNISINTKPTTIHTSQPGFRQFPGKKKVSN